MTELTLEQLEELCSSYLEILPFYGPYEQLFFKILYETGCRPIEAHTYRNWTVQPGYYIKLITKKRNNPRQIYKDDLTLDVWNYFDEGYDKLNNYSLGKFSFIFNKFNKFNQIYNGNKGIDLYCFRSLYVKKLKFIKGYSDTQIQEIMGWTNSHLPGIYYNSVLFFR